ncbi:MAG: ECF transporter S component [Anaerolineaceae bacterium]|nr:ECF transporter S component [Anaerolineaceae bacterium]
MTSTNASLRLKGRDLLAMVIGIILYGGISWLTNISPLSGSVGGEIRPGIAIPIVFGFVYGPIVGFGVGLFGNLLGDSLSGYLYGYPLPPAFFDVYPVPKCCEVVAGYLLNYQFGNGLIGLIPGIYALFRRRYRSIGDIIAALVVTVIAIVAGIGFAAGTDIIIYGQEMTETIRDFVFIPIVRVNIINAAILVPILLFNYERLDLSNMREWFRSGLVRRLSLVILVSAALPVGLLGLFLVEQATTAGIVTEDINFKLGFTVLITLIFAAANAVLVAQTISRPLLRLTGAAKQMGAGELSSDQAGELKATQGTDEIAQLSQLFGQMAQEVIQREERLKRQVEELRIEVDLAKQQQQVSEITDNEYFRELKEKVNKIRAQAGKQSESEE